MRWVWLRQREPEAAPPAPATPDGPPATEEGTVTVNAMLPCASAERVTASFCTVVSAVKKKNLTPPRPASSERDTWQDIVDSTTKCRFRAKDPGVSQLVQREAEYVELIVSLVEVQIKLEESSGMDFAKVHPPAIVNTYGAGKTVLGETVVDVMVSNAGVYDKCRASWCSRFKDLGQPAGRPAHSCPSVFWESSKTARSGGTADGPREIEWGSFSG